MNAKPKIEQRTKAGGRLTLARETVRNLSATELEKAQGGQRAPSMSCYTCGAETRSCQTSARTVN